MSSSPLPHHEVVCPAAEPLLILGPSLGTSTLVWEPHLPFLSRHFRVLRYDLPGHGGSPTGLLRDPAPDNTEVDDIASLVLRLADRYRGDRFHYAGISLGGAVGAHLAAWHPDRVASLALICTSAHFGAARPWHERAALVRTAGTAPLLLTSPDRWFAEPAAANTPFGRRLLDGLTGTDPTGYAACCDALADYDLRTDLSRITAPTLVVGGSRDTTTPLDHARELAHGIPQATLEIIDCGHLAVEQPHALRHALTAHLSSSSARAGAQAPRSETVD